MTPKAFRAGGLGTSIRFALSDCWLGFILVAATEKGVSRSCSAMIPMNLRKASNAISEQRKLLRHESEIERLVAKVISLLETPSIGLDLPLDIRGTAFQHAYGRSCEQSPSDPRPATRRLHGGSANQNRYRQRRCSSLQIRWRSPSLSTPPCVRMDRWRGYRWGIERKRRLLEGEKEAP